MIKAEAKAEHDRVKAQSDALKKTLSQTSVKIDEVLSRLRKRAKRRPLKLVKP